MDINKHKVIITSSKKSLKLIQIKFTLMKTNMVKSCQGPGCRLRAEKGG